MTYHGPKKTEIDVGYLYGWNAGRFTVHERGFGKWEILFHAVRGPDVSLGTITTKRQALRLARKIYAKHSLGQGVAS